MTSQDFMYIYYMPHADMYFFALFVSIGIFLFFLGRIVRSLIDPLLLSILGICLSSAVPVFLMFQGGIKADLFLYFIINQLIIVLCFYIFNYQRKTIVLTKGASSDTYSWIFFKLAFLIYVLTTLYAWIINGIPIFNENRFDINTNNSSGILGLLNRISSALFLYVIIYVYYIFFHESKKKATILFGILLILHIFSGSKAFILSFIKAFFFYSVFYEGKIPNIKLKYIPFIVISPIVVIVLVGYADNTTDAWIYWGYRLLANGDTYWNAYPNSVIDYIKIESPLTNMTFLFWGPFRHILGVDVDNNLMKTVGGFLFQQNYGFYPDGGSPNSQLPIISYAYFRWYGIVLTFAISLFCSYLYRQVYTTKSSKSIYNCCKKGLWISVALGLFGDVYLLFNSIFQLLLFCLSFNLLRIILKK